MATTTWVSITIVALIAVGIAGFILGYLSRTASDARTNAARRRVEPPPIKEMVAPALLPAQPTATTAGRVPSPGGGGPSCGVSPTRGLVPAISHA